MVRLFQVASILSLASVGFAALPIPGTIPLAITGVLGPCTVDGSEYNSGGFVDVDGWHVKVPKNLLVQFPVVWAPFPQLCDAGAGGYEVTIMGNVIGGVPVAGQISVSAGLSLRGSQGYIESINTADASMKIRNGPTIKLSDPNGKFAKANNAKPFFPVDDENPSVTAWSGFPMCVPRDNENDPKCPKSNRVDGQTNFAAPNPKAMVPFQPGDFIEYTGLVDGGIVYAYEVVAINVQVTTTASNDVPNYIRMEEARVGVVDTAANVEVDDFRFVGFLSDCSSTVTFSAIEVDPCTGKENLRVVGSGSPKAGDPRCKFDIRFASTGKTPFTREYMVTVNTPVVETDDGIKASQYVMPVSEWVFPEVDVPGTEPPPYPFKDFLGSVQGDFLDDKQYGQLDPFPAANPGSAKTCSSTPSNPDTPTNDAPVADAVAITAVQRVGAQILLAGSNTNNAVTNSNLNFNWSKTSPASPSISITNPSQATATFTAPKVTTETTFEFEFTASLKSNATKKDTKKISIKVSPTAVDVVSVDTYTWVNKQSGTISVTCHSNVVNGDNSKMTLELNSAATSLTMSNAGAGKWSYNARSTKQPTNIRCVSNLGGKSNLVTAPLRRRKRGVLGIGA